MELESMNNKPTLTEAKYKFIRDWLEKWGSYPRWCADYFDKNIKLNENL